jgi:hypothetical protein
MNRSEVDAWAESKMNEMQKERRKGYEDCENGDKPDNGRLEEYYLGYAARHQEEAIQDARTSNER